MQKTGTEEPGEAAGGHGTGDEGPTTEVLGDGGHHGDHPGASPVAAAAASVDPVAAVGGELTTEKTLDGLNRVHICEK